MNIRICIRNRRQIYKISMQNLLVLNALLSFPFRLIIDNCLNQLIVLIEHLFNNALVVSTIKTHLLNICRALSTTWLLIRNECNRHISSII